MKGDTRETKYFGTYTEQRDTDNLPIEIIGKVIKKVYADTEAAYLVSEAKGNKRYDLPKFMLKYADQRVAVLARVFTKPVGEKVYYKLVVIAVRELKENNYEGRKTRNSEN